ncbi:phenylacetate--CoA ligase family protein [Roseateles saccharophilus]|uniref:Phenylacetate-coenzyme A ligase PaaK-like adenylate-forming protein n=2 Tax=Roseateles saccharophilus TaxID=304 RepID=A0A4R3UG90_ROSSA|nr:phenylacetate--CoA ligase family protein [Roseateles saccharophilus]TCU89824.1 phenylacetate-coenzyme A ligase PaaK-like adenylate-forming protein [Roseateles saccharophilus]
MAHMASLATLNPDAWLYAGAWSATWWSGLHPETVGLAMRQRRLARLIDQALSASPFYKKRGGGRLCDFRPTTKHELMACFDDWATDRRITRAALESFVADPQRAASPWLGRYLVWTSSGTSGEMGYFIQDATSMAAYDAIDSLRLRGRAPLDNLNPLWGLDQRFAFVGATGGHFAGFVSLERMRRATHGRPTIQVVSALEPVARIAEQLAVIDPTVLICYPSAAVLLAERQLSGTLGLDLTEVWLGGEQFTPGQRALIQAAFQCPVRNNYGASEFFSIASECRFGNLHVNEDWVILEPVDANLQPLSGDGFSASVLLTNLANLVQPLLRYQLTDRVRFAPRPCPCGDRFRVIEVDGRSDDILRFQDAQGGPVPVLPLALETVIEEGAGITHFQLLCRGSAVIEVRFDAELPDAPAAYERLRAVLLAYLRQHRVAGLRTRFSRAAPQREQRSGKLRRIVAVQARSQGRGEVSGSSPASA